MEHAPLALLPVPQIPVYILIAWRVCGLYLNFLPYLVPVMPVRVLLSSCHSSISLRAYVIDFMTRKVFAAGPVRLV